jgi:hypothetical protein
VVVVGGGTCHFPLFFLKLLNFFSKCYSNKLKKASYKSSGRSPVYLDILANIRGAISVAS